jgi:hypothetical protein
MTGELARDETDSNNKEIDLSTTEWEESKWGTKDRDETNFEKIHVSRRRPRLLTRRGRGAPQRSIDDGEKGARAFDTRRLG